MSDPLARILGGMAPRKPLRMERVKIATVSPFTVTLPSGATVTASPMAGASFTVNGAGVAFYYEGGIPFVLPSA